VIESIEKGITPKQMSSLHVAFRQFSNGMNDSGRSVQQVVHLPLSFTEAIFKESIARVVLNHFLMDIREDYKGEGSFTELFTHEVDPYYDELNRAIGEKFGVSLPYPCLQSMMDEFDRRLLE